MGNKSLCMSSQCRPFPHNGTSPQETPIASSLNCCVLEGLLEDTVDPIPPAQHAECMKAAIFSSDPNLLEKILQRGVDPNVKWFEPALLGEPSTGTGLHLATALHNEAMLNILLKHSADVNIKNHFGETALHTAGYVGNSSALLMLLEGKNFRCLNSISKRRWRNQDRRTHVNCTALEMAANRKKVPCVKVLLRNGAKIGKAVQKLIALMNKDDDAELCMLLLRQGLEINQRRGRYKETLLHMAVRKNNPQVRDVLLEAGAKVNAQDHKHSTPLIHAISRIEEQAIEPLIQAGADINMPDKFNAPIHYAASYCHAATIEKLISYGAKLTTVGSKETFFSGMPHHMCITSPLFKIRALHVLLLHGAPLEASSGQGTAIKMAWEDTKGTMNPKLALLMCHGACVDFIFHQLSHVYVYRRDYSTLPDMVKLIVYSGNENGDLSKQMNAIQTWFYAVDHKYQQWFLHFRQIVPSLKIQSRRAIRRSLRKYSDGYSVWNHIGKTNLPPLLQDYLRLSDLSNFESFEERSQSNANLVKCSFYALK